MCVCVWLGVCVAVCDATQICVKVPQSSFEAFVFESTHLVFQLLHVSSTPSKTHCFAFCFLELADNAGVAIQDGQREVCSCACVSMCLCVCVSVLVSVLVSV